MARLVFKADSKRYFKWPYPMDTSDITDFVFMWRPPVWAEDTVYIEEIDLVVPWTDNGFYYVPVSGGRSQVVETPTVPPVPGTSEPLWSSVSGETVLDGTVEWQAQPYDFMLDHGEVITDSTWEVPTGIQVVASSFNDYSSTVIVKVLDDTLEGFLLTNKMTHGVLVKERSVFVTLKQEL